MILPLPKFLSQSFRNKLVVSFTTLIIFTVGVIVLVVNARLQNISAHKIEEEMLVTANVLAEVRRTQLKNYSDASASLIRYNPQLRASLAEYNQAQEDLFGEGEEEGKLEAYQALEDIVREVDLFQQSRLFIIADARGKVLYQKGGRYLVDRNLSDSNAVATALAGNEIFTWWGKDSPIYKYLPADQTSAAMMLYEVFFKPVTFGADMVGLLIIGFTPTDQLSMIKNTTLSDIAFFQGDHLYASSGSMAFNPALANIAQTDHTQDRLHRFLHQEEEFMVLVQPVVDGLNETIGKILIFRSQTKELLFFENLSHMLNGIGLAGIVTAMILALIISGVVVRAVRNLSKGAEAVKNGNLDIEIPVVTHDELGQLAQAFNGMIHGLREKERITDTFKKYVSSSVVDEILKSNVQLGGERKELTVYFSDIANFTPISESMSAEDLIAFLNQYLTQMTQLLEQHFGIVDKYIGDAIMAFWGAPLPLPDHPHQACLTALKQQAWHVPFRQQWRHHPILSQVMTRIGIHTGEVVVGNVGSENRMDYTIIGDTVNLASRLESLNKFYGTSILISESTYDAIGSGFFVTRPIDLVQVKGKSEALVIYELMELSQDSTPTQRTLSEWSFEGFRHYRQRKFHEALGCFQRCLELMPQDVPARLYIERCQELITTPPPPSWNGVQVMMNK